MPSKRPPSALLSAVAVLVVRLAGALGSFAVAVAAARSMPAADVGVFLISITAVTIASTVCRRGVDNSLIRVVSANDDPYDRATAAAATSAQLRRTATYSVPLALAALGAWCVDSFPPTSFAGEWRPTLLALAATPLLGWSQSSGAALIGLHRQAAGVGLAFALTPVALVTLITAAAAVGPLNAASAVLLYVFAVLTTAVIATGALFRWRLLGTRDPKIEADLFRPTRALFQAEALNQATLWSTQLTAPLFLTTADLGMFVLAQRLASAITMAKMAIRSTYSPQFSSAYSRGGAAALAPVITQSSRLLALLIGLPALLLLIFPNQVLGLIQPEYTAAAGALRVFATGQLVATLCGTVGALLMMTGGDSLHRNCVATGATIAIALAPPLMWLGGMTGGAAAAALAIGTQNLLGAYYVRKRLGLWSFRLT